MPGPDLFADLSNDTRALRRVRQLRDATESAPDGLFGDQAADRPLRPGRSLICTAR